MEGKRAVRSVTRGIGTVQQRTPLDIEQIIQSQADRPLLIGPLLEDGPLGVHALVVLGCYFMLREAEASLLLLANVNLDQRRKQVTTRLPSSKTDPAAASVDRSWGCLCNTRGMHGCPYHLAEAQVHLLHSLFSDGHDQHVLPFFPTELGTTVEKVKAVETRMVHACWAGTLCDWQGREC